MSSDLSNTPMSSTPWCALGIDVGGTKIAAGLVRFPDARLLARRIIATCQSCRPHSAPTRA